MKRYVWLAVVALLASNERVRAEEPPSTGRCLIPVQPAKEKTQPARPAARAEKVEDIAGFFDVPLEATADCLYEQAVRLDNEGRSERAADMLLTLLQQCPEYQRRDDVVTRLSGIASRWMRDVREVRQRQREVDPLRVSATITPENPEWVIDKASQAERLLDAVERSVLADSRVIDVEDYASLLAFDLYCPFPSDEWEVIEAKWVIKEWPNGDSSPGLRQILMQMQLEPPSCREWEWPYLPDGFTISH